MNFFLGFLKFFSMLFFLVIIFFFVIITISFLETDDLFKFDGRGLRIKYVCRKVVVVLGKFVVKFLKFLEIIFSVLLSGEKVKLWKKD